MRVFGAEYGTRPVNRVRRWSLAYDRFTLADVCCAMRLLICAIGRLKQGPERELAASYRKRAEVAGRPLGLREIEVIEIRESRA